ncbi:MAG: histidine kinase [Myxococcaceae bacterium]|nr:histidine kinase [Myxococcaceae bacterium]
MREVQPARGAVTPSLLGAVTALCLLLGGVVAGALELIESDRRQLADKFAAERLAHADEAVELTRRDLEGVAVVLRLASELVEGPEADAETGRELRALLAASEHFQHLAVFEPDGAARLSVPNPRLSSKGPELEVEAALRAAAEKAEARRGELQISEPLSGGERSRRVVAIAPANADAHVVAMLVDSDQLLSKLRLLASDPATNLLLLGPHGRVSAPSHPRLAAVVAASSGLQPEVAQLVGHLRRGERGTQWMSGAVAASMGLGDAEVLSTYAPVHTDGLGQWGLAVLTSTSVLRDAERSLTTRLAAAAAVIALVLIAFGVFLVLASRRAAVTGERLLHAERLARLHERTEKTLDNIPAGVMSLTHDLTVSSVNRVLRERMPQVVLPCPLAEALPEAPASVLERLAALVGAAASTQFVQSIHGEQLALFGSEGQYSVHAVPLGTAFDEARSLLVFDDVSEVRSLESQLLRAEKLATIGVLAAGLAHEIGTPLGIVRARAEYVHGKLGAGHDQARGLQVIIDQIDRVTRTIRQMLDFSRVRPAAVRPVALAQVATWLQEVVRYEAQRRHVALSVEVATGLPDVSADPDQLQQVLLNLVMNACDACREGGHVTVKARVAGEAWPSAELAVEDDGCGIPEEQLQGVFDPFFTTKKGGQGTGLGLTVAAQIVRNHGGRIELKSEVGKGTRVAVLWPLARTNGGRSTHAA